MKEELCPICQVKMEFLKNTDLYCPSCKREWYEAAFGGEPSLCSRSRKVKLNKWPPLRGDHINDVISPVD